MRLLIGIIALFMLNNTSAQTPVKHSFGLSASYRGFNYPCDALSFNTEYFFDWKYLSINTNLGFERWYVKRGNGGKYSFDMKPTCTGKTDIYIGMKTPIFKSNFFISTYVGIRFYMFNRLVDSTYLTSDFPVDDSDLNLSTTSKAYSAKHGDELVLGSHLPNKAWGYNINSMPYALLTRLDIGYKINHFSIRVFALPYWVCMNYENKLNPTIKGRKFYFFYDVGLGVNYTLPTKKKESKAGKNE